MKLVIEGAPRTKKNSLRRIRRGRRTFTVPSAAHEAWEAMAIPQLRKQHSGGWGNGNPAITWTANMRAIVYRDRAVGDLLNYLAAVSDALERAGVVADDKLIVSVDGSRMAIDRQRPRVEIDLTPAAG
jgi:Holliday junction resolvase RusA-like endonuclease